MPPACPRSAPATIELVCMVPTGWQQITVTIPDLVTNKTLISIQ